MVPVLLPKLITILHRIQQDPTAVASLSTKLIRSISFTDVLSFTNEEILVQALRSPFPALQKLGLEVVERSIGSATNVALLSVMKGLVKQLISTWLSTPDVGSADKAGNIIAKGLNTDCKYPLPMLNDRGEFVTHPAGQGLLWRRIFTDSGIYYIIFELCGRFSPLDSRQISLAQSRLAAIMPRLAQINLAAITESIRPEVELRQHSKNLLDFVAIRMIDHTGGDELMRLTHYRFWYELFAAMSKVQCSRSITQILASLIAAGVEADKNMKPFLKSGIFYLADNPEDMEQIVSLLRTLGLGLENQGGDTGMSL